MRLLISKKKSFSQKWFAEVAFYFHVVILAKIAVLRVAADRAEGGGPVIGQMVCGGIRF